jgi:N-acetylmuramoyl-L-alanine amidase
MEKGFLGTRTGVYLTLLAIAAGASGKLVAADIRDVRVSATETSTRIVLDLSAPARHKAFLLNTPGRVVVDLPKSTLKAGLPAVDGVVTRVRSGKLPHGGLRLVFEVAGPVTFETVTLAPAGVAQ